MAANPERGELEVVINGTTYLLVLRTAALIALQKHFSTDDHVAEMDMILTKMEQKSFEHLVAGFWASLQKYHPNVSYQEAVNLLDDCDDWEKIYTLFASLIAANRPDVKDVAEVASRPQKARAKRIKRINGTGESTTSSPVASV